MSWVTTEEREDRVILTADINPSEVDDQELPEIGQAITQAADRLPTGQPVILAGNWPLWAIARAARLAHPKAAWIGVKARDGTVIVVRSGQENGQKVPLASVRERTYVGQGPCHMDFRQTSARGVYRLDVVHPTPGRPIDGHTTVNLQSVRAAIEGLKAPADLKGVLITGHAWRVVIAMVANSPALREVQWCAVDEPRRYYAVMSWGSHTGGEEQPGTLVPRDDLMAPPSLPKQGHLLKRVGRWWNQLSDTAKAAIIAAFITGLLGLCGALYGPTVSLLFNRPHPTPTPTLIATATQTSPLPAATATAP